MTNQEACDCIRDDDDDDAQKAAKKLVKEAKSLGSYDDISCIVVMFYLTGFCILHFMHSCPVDADWTVMAIVTLTVEERRRKRRSRWGFFYFVSK